MTEERNQEIGQELQRARLDQGLSLDDVQQTTKIQKRYLQAIETGQFDQLPGAFYERAFVRQYAATVGLDVAKFMEQHDIERTEVEPDLSGARLDADNITRSGMRFEEETAAQKTRQYLPRVIVGVVIVAVIGIIWAVFANYVGSSKSQATSSSEVSVTSSSVASEASKADDKSSAKKTSTKSSSTAKKTTFASPAISGTTSTIAVTPADKSKDMVLHLSALNNARVWLSVTDNNKASLYSGVLEANGATDVTIPASVTSVTVSSGNALNTAMKLDDVDVNAGATSSVWNTVFTIAR
jgi:cytoskeletal protein RodZ